MNGKQAKRLRKIAAELGRPAGNNYAWAGHLQRRQDIVLGMKGGGDSARVIRGAPIRRPLALGDCNRRAIQEAKKLYKEQAGEI